MKPIAMSMSLVIAGMFVPAAVFGKDNNHNGDDECSVATLFGNYLFTGSADAPGYPQTLASYPRVFAGVYTFDGEGKMSGVSSQSQGGVIMHRTPQATYTLNPDCTGTITFSGGERFDIFIARDGSEGNFIRVDEGTIATRTIRRQ